MPESTPDLVTANLGLITLRCLKHYPKLPGHVRIYYDLEDMVNDVASHITNVAHQYDPDKAKVSTWLWRVTDNYCKSILHHYYSKQYTACAEVSIEDVMYLRDTSTPPIDIASAKSRMEALLRMASPMTRNFLEYLFKRPSSESPLSPSDDTVQELISLTRRLGMQYADFKLVLDTCRCR